MSLGDKEQVSPLVWDKRTVSRLAPNPRKREFQKEQKTSCKRKGESRLIPDPMHRTGDHQKHLLVIASFWDSRLSSMAMSLDPRLTRDWNRAMAEISGRSEWTHDQDSGWTERRV